MRELEERLRERLPIDVFDTLYPLLKEFRDRGGSAEDALTVLKTLRAEAEDEVIEDRILELMDIAVGFCSPHLRIW